MYFEKGRKNNLLLHSFKARVAELVDALVSKTSSFQGVPVRPRPRVLRADNQPLINTLIRGFLR